MGGRGRARQRRNLRRILLATIILLYVLSIPWYRSPNAELRVWLGLPDWAAVALGCYVAIAVLNCVAWALAEVPDSPQPRAGDEPR